MRGEGVRTYQESVVLRPLSIILCQTVGSRTNMIGGVKDKTIESSFLKIGPLHAEIEGGTHQVRWGSFWGILKLRV